MFYFKYKVPVMIFLALIFAALTQPVLAQKDKDKNPKLSAPPVPEAAPRTPFSDVRRDSLLNGLQIVTLEKNTSPKVICHLTVRGGSMFDLVGKAGVATLTVETLLAVNPKLKEDLASLEAQMDWGVTLDHTWFRIEAPAQNLQETISIIARLLVTDVIRKESFAKAHQKHLEHQKSLQLPAAAQADEAFIAALYGDHPYAHTTEGNAASIVNIQYGDVYDFYKRVYLANNMFAVVEGNLKREKVMNIFRTYFGSWIKGSPAPPTFRPPTRTPEVRVIKIEQAGLSNVEIRGGVIGVSHTDADYLATVLLSRLLDKRLKQIEATSMTSFPPRVLAAPIHFSASVPAERAVEISRQITDIFAQLSKQEISEVELATAQAALLEEHRAKSVSEYLREIATYKLPETYPLNFENKVKAITTLDLQRVAKRLLDANALTVLVMGKVSEIKG